MITGFHLFVRVKHLMLEDTTTLLVCRIRYRCVQAIILQYIKSFKQTMVHLLVIVYGLIVATHKEFASMTAYFENAV